MTLSASTTERAVMTLELPWEPTYPCPTCESQDWFHNPDSDRWYCKPCFQLFMRDQHQRRRELKGTTPPPASGGVVLAFRRRSNHPVHRGNR